MNRLPTAERARILQMMVEGLSMQSIARLQGVSMNTVLKLLVDAGYVCFDHHGRTVRDVSARYIECDETWSFCYAKSHNLRTAVRPVAGAGSVWTWVGIDVDTKLILSWYAGDRGHESGLAFMRDLRSRTLGQPQICTDGLNTYPTAIAQAFRGTATHEPDAPNPYVERHNLTMRMSVKRLTRKTNAFSKLFRNHCATLALYFTYYNFCRSHESIGQTPAMRAGLADRPLTFENIVELINARVPAQQRGPYMTARRRRAIRRERRAMRHLSVA